jgi:hypothetical protein
VKATRVQSLPKSALFRHSAEQGKPASLDWFRSTERLSEPLEPHPEPGVVAWLD